MVLFISTINAQNSDSTLFNKVYDFTQSSLTTSSVGVGMVSFNDTIYISGLTLKDTIINGTLINHQVVYLSAISNNGDVIWTENLFFDLQPHFLSINGSLQIKNDSTLIIVGVRRNDSIYSERIALEPFVFTYNIYNKELEHDVLIDISEGDFGPYFCYQSSDSTFIMLGTGYSKENIIVNGEFTPKRIYNQLLKCSLEGVILWNKKLDETEFNSEDFYSYVIDFDISYSGDILVHTLFNIRNNSQKQCFRLFNIEGDLLDEVEVYNNKFIFTPSGPSEMVLEPYHNRLFFTSRYAEVDDRGNQIYSVPFIGELNENYDTIWSVQAPIQEYGFIRPNALFVVDSGFVVCGMNYNGYGGNAYHLKMDSLGKVFWYREFRYKKGSYSQETISQVIKTDSNYLFIGEMFNKNKVEDTLELLGTFTWLVKTNSIGCFSDTCTINIPNTIQEYGHKSEFTIYPNPSSGEFKVKVPDYSSNELHFRVYDMQGKFRYELANISNDETIVLPSFLTSGYYVAILISESGIQYSKKISIIR